MKALRWNIKQENVQYFLLFPLFNSPVLIRDGNHFCERTKCFKMTEIFLERGCCSEKKLMMDKQLGLFREMKKTIVFKNE